MGFPWGKGRKDKREMGWEKVEEEPSLNGNEEILSIEEKEG